MNIQNAFKQSGAKDTGSFKDRFRRSLIKLTFLYVAILALILFLSSSIIYSAFSSRLDRRFNAVRTERPELLQLPEPTNADDVRNDLIQSIILVNGVLLLSAGIASYWLAKWSLNPVKEAYEKQKRFLSDASHELRTPLTILHTDLENELADNSVQGVTRKRAESNLEEVERMSRLVSDLLTVSRQDEKIPVNKTKVNLTALVLHVIEHLQPVAGEHEVLLKFIQPEHPVKIMADEDQLFRAVNNIVKNGIIYNRPRGKVEIKLIDKKKSAQITITDTGIGISKIDLNKIFERFYRTDESRSRQTGGSGLGLSIARSAIERLGGKIHVSSELNSGTAVNLEFPK